MLELLLSALCIGSSFNPDACTHAWEKEQSEHPEIGDTFKDLQHTYYDSAPESVKALAGAGGVLYKREFKMNFYKNFYIDVKYQDSTTAGVKWTFP